MFPKRKTYPPPRVSCSFHRFPLCSPSWWPSSLNVCPGSRELRLIRTVVIQSHRGNCKVASCTSQTYIRTRYIDLGPHYRLHAIGTGQRRRRRGLDTLEPLTSPYPSLATVIISGTTVPKLPDLQHGERMLISPRHRDCDSPLSLTNYTLDYLEENWVNDIDFVICALPPSPPPIIVYPGI